MKSQAARGSNGERKLARQLPGQTESCAIKAEDRQVMNACKASLVQPILGTNNAGRARLRISYQTGSYVGQISRKGCMLRTREWDGPYRMRVSGERQRIRLKPFDRNVVRAKFQEIGLVQFTAATAD